MATETLRLPKALREFITLGMNGFEDGEAVSWQVELEPGTELPLEIQETYPEAQIFANNGVGDLMFLVPKPGKKSLDDKVLVFHHEGCEVERLPGRLGQLLKPGPGRPSDHPTVFYYDSDTPVRLGDRVELKLWLFLRRKGEVMYVPGVSPRKPSMERDGLAWIRVRLDSRDLVDVIVDPATGWIRRDVSRLPS